MLAGTLNDVSLPEVLALLSQASKTGSVHIIGDGRRGRIDLIGGHVGMAQSSVGRLGLVRRLVASGELNAEALAAGLEDAAVSPDPDIQLVRSAYRAGAITAEVVRDAADAHIVDAMFDLLRVETGRFRFDPCKVADLGVQRSPTDVLADVDARNQQWEQIRATVPAPGAVVRMIPRITQDEVVLTASTWRLLSLIDGRRTVADLVHVLGVGEFEVSQSLHRLVGEGLVVVVVDVGGSPPDQSAHMAEVLEIEAQLAERRSDPSSQLTGRLEWAAGDPLAPGTTQHKRAATEKATGATKATKAGKAGKAGKETQQPSKAAVVADDGVDAADEPNGGDQPPEHQGDVDDWSGVEMPEDGEGNDVDVEEPEVYTTQLLGDPDADDDDEDDAAQDRRRDSSRRRGTLAASTERRGRLLPEPEPGHDAADLTRRLLEGVGKS